MTKQEWLEKNGFDIKTENTYCVVGEDTYSIKDYLKAAGFRYSPLLGWHSGTQIALEDDYFYVTFSFDELLKWDGTEENGEAFYYENSNLLVQKRIKEYLPPSKSEFVGEVGERLRNMTAVFKSVKCYYGKFGLVYIYNFQSQENIFTWFTQKEIKNLNKGEPIILEGIVKSHEVYHEIKTTILTRCNVQKIE